MIHKITTSVDYNKLLKCLDTQLNEPTNQNVIKVVNLTNKKTLFKTMETRVLIIPMSPPSLTNVSVNLIRLSEVSFKIISNLV